MGNGESTFDDHQYDFQQQSPSYSERSIDDNYQPRQHPAYIADNFNSIDDNYQPRQHPAYIADNFNSLDQVWFLVHLLNCRRQRISLNIVIRLYATQQNMTGTLIVHDSSWSKHLLLKVL